MSAATGGGEDKDEILEEHADEILGRVRKVGEERLKRSRLDILITSVIGGVEVSLGGLGAAAVLGSALEAAPGLGLFGGLAVAGLVFPVGFVFVILGRSELFTENFLIPVAAVISRRHRVRELTELWALSWIGNILGCAGMAAIISIPEAIGDPVKHGLAVYTDYKLGVSPLGTLVSAVLAGITMTILTWLVVAVRPIGAKVVAIVSAGYILFAINLAHTVVGAALIFAGWHDAGRSLVDVARWLALATAGNLLGGVAFVTAFRVIQGQEKART